MSARIDGNAHGAISGDGLARVSTRWGEPVRGTLWERASANAPRDDARARLQWAIENNTRANWAAYYAAVHALYLTRGEVTA